MLVNVPSPNREEFNMALNDLLKLTDNSLIETFQKKVRDPQKDRKRVIKIVDRAQDQFNSSTTVRGRKFWTQNNEVVRFKPPFVIKPSVDEYFIPAERFNDFLNTLKEAINSGELDETLLEKPTPTAQKARAPWSAERRAAFEAKQAEKAKAKAAKAKPK